MQTKRRDVGENKSNFISVEVGALQLGTVALFRRCKDMRWTLFWFAQVREIWVNLSSLFFQIYVMMNRVLQVLRTVNAILYAEFTGKILMTAKALLEGNSVSKSLECGLVFALRFWFLRVWSSLATTSSLCRHMVFCQNISSTKLWRCLCKLCYWDVLGKPCVDEAIKSPNRASSDSPWHPLFRGHVPCMFSLLKFSPSAISEGSNVSM